MKEETNGKGSFFMADSQKISKQAMHRMPYYVECLRSLAAEGVVTVSAPVVAEKLKLNEVQVRKDFAAVSKSGGRAKIGFPVQELLKDMEKALGYHSANSAVLVGAGSLGHALVSYRGFEEYGLRIMAAFDTQKDLIGSVIGEVPVYDAAGISDYCQEHGIRIGVITVPADEAQEVCDMLVKGGVQGIWNFAPTYLDVPETILLQNENMAASLAILSRHLRERNRK